MDTNITSNNDTFTGTQGTIQSSYDTETSWKSSVTKFYTDVSSLIEREGQLIRTEIAEKSVEAKTAAVSLVSGGVVLFIGAMCLAATAIILCAYVMPLWLASVIVTAVFLVVGAVMLAAAKKKMTADNLVPRKSIDALTEIRYSIKEKVNEITKH